MHIDHFGNIITSIGVFHWTSGETLTATAVWGQDIPPLAAEGARGAISPSTAIPCTAYRRLITKSRLGEILAQIDSNGFLEIGANQDDAADRLDVQLGDKVMLRLA